MSMRRPQSSRHLAAVVRPTAALIGLALMTGCAGGDRAPAATAPPPPWTSRAIPEARGDFKTDPAGKRVAVRYRGWPTADFGQFRTYAYGDTRPEPRVTRAAMPAARAHAASRSSICQMAHA